MATTPDNDLRKANQFRFSVFLALIAVLVASIFGFQKLRAWRGETAEASRKTGQPKLERRTSESNGTKPGEVKKSSGTNRSSAAGSNFITVPGSSPEAAASGKDSTTTNAAAKDAELHGFATLAPGSSRSNEMDLVIAIHKKIVANSPERTEAEMRTYWKSIPGTTDEISMIAIPGGEFMMGSPESEAKRQADEGPQLRVKLDPFWMHRFEVSWDQYEPFMFHEKRDRTHESDLADAVAFPSKPYVEMSFGMGRKNYPAISMTQHAANKFCQWLSARMGHFYRLPTEAEWEYACRADMPTAYTFGDDPAGLAEYAWFADNSDQKYQRVGHKKPNRWGLHDMHGNVAEWCLDQYAPYPDVTSLVINPWNKARRPYPHVVRGGSWQDDADKCRSASRRGSDPSWKTQDPLLPKSVWFHTDAQFVGFRVVRPLKVPSPQAMYSYWNSGVELDPK